MKDPKDSQKNRKDYAKYGGMAFEMLAYLMVGYFIGSYLDGKANFDKPYLTAFMMILFVGVYLYKLIKDLSK